jgi:hypothetical protein
MYVYNPLLHWAYYEGFSEYCELAAGGGGSEESLHSPGLVSTHA